MHVHGKAKYFLGACLAMLIGAAPVVAQQTGTVAGTVRTAEGQAVSSAQVTVQGLNIGALTQQNGRFLIRNVPAGEQTLQVELIGYGTETQTVEVEEGQTVTANFTLSTEAVALGQLIVTGVSGATMQAKVPFEVSRINADDLPVPSVSAGSAIQGKVTGAQVVQGSGRPGSAPSILLRGATSINASGRSQEPLYIVDGVIVGAGLTDLNAMDIENIEVVKGAAAASLYGSRAANGVIQITTRRGAGIADDQIRYSFRTEAGRSELAQTPEALLAKNHPFELVEVDGETLFVDDDTGEPCAYLQCSRLAAEGSNAWNTYYVNDWPTRYDQVGDFFQNGAFMQQHFAAEGRSGETNFHISYNHLDDSGILPGLQGFQRHNFRVNVDQSVRENIHVGASAFYSLSNNDQFPETNGNPMFALTRSRAGANLWTCDPSRFEEGEEVPDDCRDRPEDLIIQTDPANSEADNPVYELSMREYRDQRSRFLGSGVVRWTPIDWFDIEGNVSYDRLNYEATDYFPKGFRTITASSLFNEGYLDRLMRDTEALNTSVTATFRASLAEGIDNRTQLRYLYEQNNLSQTFTSGYDMTVADIVNFDNLNPENLGASSLSQPVRADGYFVITNFDLYDRYIVDALIRNDGSSLFGEEQRRAWYYRIGGVWRVGMEPWFEVDAIDELKLRYSYGTAGGRPNFSAQYETFSVSGGAITPVNLGNSNLRPEFSREHEVGADAAIFDGRVVLGLTYANTTTEDQILPVPLPSYTGYAQRWENAGTLESNTWEASLDARLYESDDLRWSGRLLWDRTRSVITELNVPDFVYGVAGQNLNTVFYAREGEELGTFYGVQFATECGHLPESVQGQCDSQFAVNDEGLLVWVGEHGLNNPEAWGETAPAEIQTSAAHLAGLTYGTPLGGLCEDRSTGERRQYCPVGNSMPDYSVSLSSTLDWHGLSVYGLLDAVQGFDVYNQPLQWATYAQTNALFDQGGVPEDQRKPEGYFNALYGVSGLQPSSYFVEDGSFVKLREVSVRYRFDSDGFIGSLPGLNNLDGVSVFAVGRNLRTWTDYRGFDPEVGKTGGQTGSAALARVEGFQYPNFRTWTIGAELNF